LSRRITFVDGNSPLSHDIGRRRNSPPAGLLPTARCGNRAVFLPGINAVDQISPRSAIESGCP
jgi:hypothetical protein